MLYDAVENPADHGADGLREAYLAELGAVATDLGVDTVVGATGVPRETVEALTEEDSDVELTLSEAAEILALRDGMPDADGIVLEVRDHLLMGMTTGVVDVDTVASGLDIDLTGTEVQQALEGRRPVTLVELAAIQAFIAARNDR